MDRAADLESRLRAALEPTHVAVTDDSHHHEGHAGHSGAAGTHMTVIVVSARFQGLSRVDRQRLVYSLFAGELSSGALHALALTTHTPDEWARHVSRSTS